jgi:hypothetical protein
LRPQVQRLFESVAIASPASPAPAGGTAAPTTATAPPAKAEPANLPPAKSQAASSHRRSRKPCPSRRIRRWPAAVMNCDWHGCAPTRCRTRSPACSANFPATSCVRKSSGCSKVSRPPRRHPGRRLPLFPSSTPSAGQSPPANRPRALRRGPRRSRRRTRATRRPHPRCDRPIRERTRLRSHPASAAAAAGERRPIARPPDLRSCDVISLKIRPVWR